MTSIDACFRRLSGALVTSVVLITLPAAADSIYLKDGTQIDGIVIHQGSDITSVTVGSRPIKLRTDEIALIEPNDKKGGFDLGKAQEEALARQAELDRESGLTAAQRKRVKTIMKDLKSTDESVRREAHDRLVALGKEADLFKYFSWWLPSLSPRFKPQVLGLLAEVAPQKAAPIISEFAQDVDGATRATAITLLSRLESASAVPTVARGLRDHEPEVKIAAALALGSLEAKPATPALIETLKMTDRRVANAAATALNAIWSDATEAQAAEMTTEEWQVFWSARATTVPNALQFASLEPLVPEGVKFENE